MKFLEFFTKPFIWCTVISAALAAFTVFVLLDTFVLEKRYLVVDNEPVASIGSESPVSTPLSTESSYLSSSSFSLSPSSGTSDFSSSLSSSSGSSDSSSDSSSTSGSSDSSSDSSSTSNLGDITPTVMQEADQYADFDSYYDGNVRIKLTRTREYETDIYLAEIVISDVTHLKSAFAENTFGLNIKAKPSVMAEEHNAILAVNGDFYGAHKNGYVFRNGTLYQSTTRRDTQYDDLLIYKDGSFGYINEETTEASTLAESNVWHLLRFGPVLLDKGQIIVDKNSEPRRVRISNPRTASGPELLDEDEDSEDEDPRYRKPRISNPRTALGLFEPLHYLFVVADGRTDASAGLSLYELAEVMKEAGVTMAYNLDGGGSSVIYYNGSVVNNPTDGKSAGERKVSDIVYIE